MKIHQRKNWIQCDNCGNGINVSDLLEETRWLVKKEIVKQIKKGKICLNCGREKEGKLSDWCSSCLENE